MHLILNLDSLTPPRTGIGRYTTGLLEHYLHLPEEKLRITGLYHGKVVDCRTALQQLLRPAPGDGNGGKQRLRRIAGLLPGMRRARQGWRHRRYRRLLDDGRTQNRIYHEPNYVALPLDDPLVVTVHDLSHLRYPQFHPRQRVKWLERELPKSLQRAQQVITVSEFSRRELITMLGLPEAKVTAIALGVDPRFHRPDRETLIMTLDPWKLRPGEYLATVGTLEPRKNLPRLLEAYSRLPDKLRSRYPLVIAGTKGWHTQELDSLLSRLERRGEVRWLGYVPDELLPALYGGAAAFAYVSLYEGFGLPVLEAMACATPVLTSKDSAMSSWAKESVKQVDPRDVEAISRALSALLEDRTMAQTLASRGERQAKQFSWQRCASETLALYTQVVENR